MLQRYSRSQWNKNKINDIQGKDPIVYPTLTLSSYAPMASFTKKERRLNESKVGDDTLTSHTVHLHQRAKPEMGTEKYITSKNMNKLRERNYREKNRLDTRIINFMKNKETAL